ILGGGSAGAGGDVVDDAAEGHGHVAVAVEDAAAAAARPAGRVAGDGHAGQRGRPLAHDRAVHAAAVGQAAAADALRRVVGDAAALVDGDAEQVAGLVGRFDVDTAALAGGGVAGDLRVVDGDGAGVVDGDLDAAADGGLGQAGGVVLDERVGDGGVEGVAAQGDAAAARGLAGHRTGDAGEGVGEGAAGNGDVGLIVSADGVPAQAAAHVVFGEVVGDDAVGQAQRAGVAADDAAVPGDAAAEVVAAVDRRSVFAVADGHVGNRRVDAGGAFLVDLQHLVDAVAVGAVRRGRRARLDDGGGGVCAGDVHALGDVEVVDGCVGGENGLRPGEGERVGAGGDVDDVRSAPGVEGVGVVVGGDERGAQGDLPVARAPGDDTRAGVHAGESQVAHDRWGVG